MPTWWGELVRSAAGLPCSKMTTSHQYGGIAAGRLARLLRYRVRMHRQEDDPGVDALGPEAQQGIRAAQDRHGQVGYDDIGPEGRGRIDQLAPIQKVPRRGPERRFG